MKSKTNTNLPLIGKKGIITGIANDKSIAYAAAKSIVEQGGEVIITYQNDKTAQYTRHLAEELGAKQFIKLDVTSEESLINSVKACEEEFGTIDFLIHSMAYCTASDLHGRVVDSSPDGFSMSMHISCYSFIHMGKLFEPIMNKGGSMITMSYLGAEKVVQNYGVMGVIKAALESAVRYMANDLGVDGVRVFAVSPGPIMTRAASGIQDFNQLIEHDIEKSPLHRTVTAEEVGSLTSFLCSPGASGMTGQTIYVDAGAHIVA